MPVHWRSVADSLNSAAGRSPPVSNGIKTRPVARPRSQSPGHRLSLRPVSDEAGGGDHDEVDAVEEGGDDGREFGSGIGDQAESVQRHADLAGREQAETAEALADPDPWHGFTHYIETVCAMQAADRGFAAVLTMTFPAA
jgi:hypothetical protein